MWIPMLKTRRSRDRLTFNIGILIPGKDGHYIETGPMGGCSGAIGVPATRFITEGTIF